ncbi:MAG: hypothetical protein K9L30_18790 [Desulfobacterales bacterium]|nr:hypothetical protein [Desulfobacterales bacterium]
MSPALVPMAVNGGLNSRNIFFGNGPFSDGNGQHVHRISERFSGRQQKIHKPQKKIVGRGLFEEIGVDFWVEMKKDGLKTGAKPGISQY